MTTLLDNVGDSMDQFCNELESGTSASDNFATHCCVNHFTLKMVCAKIFAIDSSQNTGSPIIIGDLDVIGRCDYSLSDNSCS